METGIIEKIITQGGMFGIALFALWAWRQDWQRSIEREERHAQQLEQLWEMTREALENNTKAMTRLAERLGGV